MTVAQEYTMSWGAELRPDGSARFRLWAPTQCAVSVVATANGSKEAMTATADGWFSLETRLVGAGEAYAFELADDRAVPDPASRAQLGNVQGPSLLVDPQAYTWQTDDWTGRPWSEAVIYELHTGAFTSEGTFAGVATKLDHLARTGVTAIELMPVAQFSGDRGWGYDGVLLYAPHVAYGGPHELKRLVDEAHARGIMVLLDVVYNHFGPDGNYLHLYAPQFFDQTRQTPWGAAIDYSQTPVRRFAIENALYWLEEYRIDGLRLDAIDQISDTSDPHILVELASEVRGCFGDRHVHLTTEDERNITRLHIRDQAGRPVLYTGEWNDDFHHVAHVITTGESDGYYVDYVEKPVSKLAAALTEGYVYQGQPSVYKHGEPRGEPSTDLPPLAFVNCIQNHDQIGNRAFGDRLTTLARAEEISLLTAVLLLSPQVPMLYMGEEWGETRPFLFFTDFDGQLADAVREGRRNEFQRWPQFWDPEIRARIPDPNALSTFMASQPDWSAPAREPHKSRLNLVQRLLAARRQFLMPWIGQLPGGAASTRVLDDRAILVDWQTSIVHYQMLANVSDAKVTVPASEFGAQPTDVRLIFEVPDGANAKLSDGVLEPWSGVFLLARTNTQEPK